MQKLIDGVWVDCTEGDLIYGDIYRISVGGGWQQQEYKEEESFIDIKITSVTGAIYHSPDFSKTACYQLTDMVVSGTVDIADRFFAMPVKNVATGEIVFFGAQVTDKAFSVVINFEKSSQYQYTNDEANLDLPSQEYNVLPMKFDVLRKTA